MTSLLSKIRLFATTWSVFLMFQEVKAQAQMIIPDPIIADGKIQWDHFSGYPDNDSKFSAMIYWCMYYRWTTEHVNGDTVKTDLNTWMVVTKKSWVKQEQKSDELLRHEQGHFNIALLAEAEFKKTVHSTTLLESNCRATIDSIFETVMSKYGAMELLYDEETNHMLKRKKQMQWNKKLSEMLQVVRTDMLVLDNREKAGTISKKDSEE